MIILGIDPGLATMGYGVIAFERGNAAVVDYGVVTTPKDLTLPQRLNRIEEGVIALIEKFRPDNIAIEELFFSKNITNGIMVAEARGVILLTADKLVGEEVYEYTPNQIKQAITGRGGASKEQVAALLKSMLHVEYDVKRLDATDGLAVALCHAHTSRLSTEFKVR